MHVLIFLWMHKWNLEIHLQIGAAAPKGRKRQPNLMAHVQGQDQAIFQEAVFQEHLPLLFVLIS